MDISNVVDKQSATQYIKDLTNIYWTKDVEYYCYNIFQDVIKDADEHNSRIDRMEQYINTLSDEDINNEEFKTKLYSIESNCIGILPIRLDD